MAVILVGGGRRLTMTAGCPGLPLAGPRCLPAVAVSSTGSAHHREWWFAVFSRAAEFSGVSLPGPSVIIQHITVEYGGYLLVLWGSLRLPVGIFVVCWLLVSTTPPRWLSCLEGLAPGAVGQLGEVWPNWTAELCGGGVPSKWEISYRKWPEVR